MGEDAGLTQSFKLIKCAGKVEKNTEIAYLGTILKAAVNLCIAFVTRLLKVRPIFWRIITGQVSYVLFIDKNCNGIRIMRIVVFEEQSRATIFLIAFFASTPTNLAQH